MKLRALMPALSRTLGCALLAACAVEAPAPPDGGGPTDAPVSGPPTIVVYQSGEPAHTVWLSGFVTDGCQPDEDRASPDCTRSYPPGTSVRASTQLGVCPDGSEAGAEWYVDGEVTKVCPAGRLTCRLDLTPPPGVTEVELAIVCPPAW